MVAVDPHSQPAQIFANRASSARTHDNNFDPTPSASSNIPPPDIARHIPCRNFPAGTCKYGDQCAFSHGLPGIAGSPGVAAEIVVAPQQQLHPQHHHQQLAPQHEEYMHDQNGMPMYYPEQGMDYGAYQQQFAPQQGYYPFPPPFQHYPQHYQQGPPPQQYFQHAPPQQLAPQMHPEAPLPSPSPSNITVPEQQQAPTSPSVQRALTPVAAFPSPPLQQLAPQSYAPYVPQAFAPEFAYQQHAPAPTSPTAFGPDGLPLRQDRAQSLHTFFQTGTPPPQSLPQLPNPSAPNAFPKGAIPPPRAPLAARPTGPRTVPIPSSAVPTLPFKAGPRGRFNGVDGLPHRGQAPRPPCSFFEGNRCRNRDECAFLHLLPDGSDARFLRQGLVGVDGRTDNPEEKGGIPPAWIANPKPFGNNRFLGPNGLPRASMNGGYSVREPKPRQQFAQNGPNGLPEGPRAEMEQLRQQSLDATLTNANAVAQKAAAAALAHPSLSIAPNARPFVAGSAAPSLVAAINGLTRRIPAVPSSTPNTAAPQQPLQHVQRVPSGADFPALSIPISPSLDTSNTLSTPASPVIEATPELGASTVIVEPVVPTPAAVETAASEHSDSDFVMVSHDEASPPSAVVPVIDAEPIVAPTVVEAAPVVAPVVAAPAPAPAPRIMGSFASAAARGAAVPAPVVEKVRKVVAAPVVVAKEEVVVVKEGGAAQKKKERKPKERREREPKAAVPAVAAVKA